MNSFRKYISARLLLGIAVASACMVAQAVGVDIQGAIASHPNLAMSLGALAMIGETAMMTPEQVKAALDKVSDQVKEWGEKAIAEAQKGLKLSETAKGDLDKGLSELSDLRSELQTIQQKFADVAKSVNAGPQHAKSAGYQIIESEAYKTWAAAKDTKARFQGSVKAVSSAANSAGVNIVADRQPGILTPPTEPLRVRNLVSPGRTSSNLIQYVKESGFDNQAAMVAEGTRKPESNIVFTDAESAVKKIAHFIKATSEIIADFPALQTIIDTRLRYGLDMIEDQQLLKGSGAGNNLFGILPQATAFNPGTAVVPNATRIDRLRLMILQSELALLPATGIVLHPMDWTLIELTKDANGAYVFANPQSLAAPGLWGRPIVTTQAMTANSALVGAFKMGAQIFDREQASVVIATENEDDFVNNKVTILAEERLAFCVYRPQAFVKTAELQPAA